MGNMLWNFVLLGLQLKPANRFDELHPLHDGRKTMKWGTRIRRIRGTNAERYAVDLEYEDGFRGTVDLSSIFAMTGHSRNKPMVLEILRGAMFDRCFVESGALAWPNGYELCPDAIRAWIQAKGRVHKRRSRAA